MTDTIEDLHELRTMRANWHALAARWDLTSRELSLILPSGGEDRPKPPVETERRMRLMLALDHRLPFDGDEGELRDWLRTPIPDLGYHSPIDLLSSDSAHATEIRRYAEWRFRW